LFEFWRTGSGSVGGNSLSIPVPITGGYIWIVLCPHQTAHADLSSFSLPKKKIYFYVVDDLKNSKPQRFLCKSRKRFIIIVAQRRGIYVDGDKPIPKKKKKPVKGLGGVIS
jgi:hypothetical protein